MRSFSDYNPISVFVFYACVIVPVMFCVNPVLMCISLAGALSFLFAKQGQKAAKKLIYLVFPLIGAVINPLFVHKGTTNLFILNNNPITLESVIYGLVMGLMISATILWFSSFNSIMTSDKLLYIFGTASPKIALILSMALRYIPLYGKQVKKVRQAQQVMGLYKEDNAIDKIRAGARIFSVMVSWALENGVITADSMTARGYGVTKRTRFSIFRWFRQDCMLLAASLVLTAVLVASMAISGLDYIWYPKIEAPAGGAFSAAAYICYAVLAFTPSYLQIREETRWRSLQQKA